MKNNERLKIAIAAGRTEYVIDELLSTSRQTDDTYKSVVSISARFKKYLNEKHMGTIPNNELNIELNKINIALLHIVDEFYSTKGITKRTYWQKKAVILGMLALISIVLIGYFIASFIKTEKSKNSVEQIIKKPLEIKKYDDTSVKSTLDDVKILPASKSQTNINITIKDNAKAGTIITGDSNTINLKQDF